MIANRLALVLIAYQAGLHWTCAALVIWSSWEFMGFVGEVIHRGGTDA